MYCYLLYQLIYNDDNIFIDKREHIDEAQHQRHVARCFLLFNLSRQLLTMNTLKGEQYIITSPHCDDMFNLLLSFVDGLKRRSIFAVVLESSSKFGESESLKTDTSYMKHITSMGLVVVIIYLLINSTPG